MMCLKCGTTAEKGITTSVTDLGECLVIVRNVPCFKCTECDEVTYTADVVQRAEFQKRTQTYTIRPKNA